MHPFFEDRLLAEISNRAMKEFVEHISKLSPATIRDYSNVVKGVVASAIDEDGKQLFPRTWNEDYIDAPVIKRQRQPSTTKKAWKPFCAKQRVNTASSMRSSPVADRCGPEKLSASRSASTSVRIAGRCTFARRPSAARFSLISKRRTANATSTFARPSRPC
jgi:hypothetical protein